MYPVICTIGPFRIYSYGLMFALASLICLFLVTRQGRRYGIDKGVFYDIYFWTLLSAIIGARLLYVLTNLEVYLSYPKEIMNIHHGGQSWFGGLVFGASAFFFVCRTKRLSFLKMADIFAPYLALAHAIGRVGCFLNGCCYGKPTASFFGVIFPGTLTPLHPTQLYSSFGLLVIFVILSIYKKIKRSIVAGRLFFSYSFLYGANRFLIEFLRGDTIPTRIYSLSLYQVFSIMLMILSVSFWVILGRRPLK